MEGLAWAAAELAVPIVSPFVSELALVGAGGLAAGYGVAQGLGYLFSGSSPYQSSVKTVQSSRGMPSGRKRSRGKGSQANKSWSSKRGRFDAKGLMKRFRKEDRSAKRKLRKSKSSYMGMSRKKFALMPKQGAAGHIFRSFTKDYGRPKYLKDLSSYGPWKTYLQNQVGVVTCSQGQQAFSASAGFEDRTHLNSLCYVDPVTAANTVTQYSLGTSAQAAMRYYIVKKLTLKNNHNYKAKVDVWDAFCCAATAGAVNGIIAGGLAENQATAATTVASTTYGIVPKDAEPLLSKFYKLKNYRAIELAAGEEVVLIHKTRIKNWNLNQYAQDSMTYFPGFHQWLYRVRGTLVHDNTTSTNVNVSAVTLDFMLETRHVFQVKYGGDMKDLQQIVSFSTVTNPDQIDPFANSLETAIGP